MTTKNPRMCHKHNLTFIVKGKERLTKATATTPPPTISIADKTCRLRSYKAYTLMVRITFDDVSFITIFSNKVDSGNRPATRLCMMTEKA